MAAKRNKEARFFRLGAGFWLVIAAFIGIAHFFWPAASGSVGFTVLAVLAAVVAGFFLVWIAQGRS